MTQITIRQVDEALAESIRKTAKDSGESMNALLLRMLRLQFTDGDDSSPPRNDLRERRGGWIEDADCDAALASFGQVEEDDWK